MKTFTLTVSVFFLTLLHPMLACVGCRQPGVGNADEPQTVLAGVGLSWGAFAGEIGPLTVAPILSLPR